MLQQSFVVLDVETTGVESKTDDIIEVALVRYEKGKETARYESLIALGRPLPPLISLITGITDADLAKEGRDRQEVMATVSELVRGAYLVGHNIGFDLAFLEAQQKDLGLLGTIDTIPLAQMVFPSSASFSLESLCDDLDIEHVRKHRAMGDVEATLALFQKIGNEAEALPDHLIAEIRDVMERSKWHGGAVFAEARGKKRTAAKAKAKIEAALSEKSLPARPLEPSQVLKSGGLLQSLWPEAEVRPQQEKMAQAVLQAFQGGHHLICEAPTGVGKSLAYLLAAAKVSIEEKARVVISTNTLNLQAQLFEKDIPLLEKIYRNATGSTGPRAVVLKGRSHYLCLRRLHEFQGRRHFSDREVQLLIKVLIWQEKAELGDDADIHLSREEQLLWDLELCSEKSICSPQKCKKYGLCYLHRAREAAENADLVIVNHALLCADLQNQGTLLPEYRYLVIDEAHHFEDAATKAFSAEIREENLLLPVRALRARLDDWNRKHPEKPASEEIFANLEKLEQHLINVFSVIALFVNRNVQESAFVENLLVDLVVSGLPEWDSLGETAKEGLAKTSANLAGLAGFVEGMEAGDTADEFKQELAVLRENAAFLQSFFVQAESSEARRIRWMSSHQDGRVGLHTAPMLPGALLKEKLYNAKKSIVLTSATLGIRMQEGSPFAYLRRMLELDDRFEELTLDTPYRYEVQSYILLPEDILALTNPQSGKQVAAFFYKLMEAVKGNTLGLFTSYSALEGVYMQTTQPLQASGVRVLAQRLSGGRNKILKAYLADPGHSLLLGTSSFWEGVDIQGEALSTLVMHKLPFDMPSDPIVKARGALFSSPFTEFSIPRAVLRFRQGFGRLIRSSKDFGVMVVLDDRLIKKDYGAYFLNALPEVTIERAKLADIPEKIKEWLRLSRES